GAYRIVVQVIRPPGGRGARQVNESGQLKQRMPGQLVPQDEMTLIEILSENFRAEVEHDSCMSYTRGMRLGLYAVSVNALGRRKTWFSNGARPRPNRGAEALRAELIRH